MAGRAHPPLNSPYMLSPLIYVLLSRSAVPMVVWQDEPNLLLVGMHHAREIMGPETVLLAARRLLEGESSCGVVLAFCCDPTSICVALCPVPWCALCPVPPTRFKFDSVHGLLIALLVPLTARQIGRLESACRTEPDLPGLGLEP